MIQNEIYWVFAFSNSEVCCHFCVCSIVNNGLFVDTLKGSPCLGWVELRNPTPLTFKIGQLSTVNCQLFTNYAFLITRPFRYSCGFSGSNFTPSKKVSTPREVVVGIWAAGTPSAVAAAFQISSRLTLSTVALMSVVAGI